MGLLPVIYVFFCSFFLVSEGGVPIKYRKLRGAGGDWGYTRRNGPSTWDGLCSTGKKQSPINIQLGSAIVKDFPSFLFADEYLSKHKFYAKNNGHSIYVALDDDSIRPAIYGGGLGGKYIFEQLHFHWESEHEFDGKRADLEMHMVHYNSKYKSFQEASTKPDGLVVLAVIFNESEETNGLLESFFNFILDAASVDEHTSHLSAPGNSLIENDKAENSEAFSLRDLLPQYVSRFFRYEGSLTTPNCGETVQWTVFINRLPVSSEVLEAFRTFRDHDGNPLTRNYRPPQNLNDRAVYIQINNNDLQSSIELQQMKTNGCDRNALQPVLYYLLIFSIFYKYNYNFI